MHKETGTLIKVYRPLRSARGSLLTIRQDSGEEVTRRGRITDKGQFEKALGRRVTIWSNTVYEAWPPFVYSRFWHVQQGDDVLIDYREQQMRWQEIRNGWVFTFKMCVALAIFPLVIIGLVCGVDTRQLADRKA
ncbi:MAG: hypothetical protein WC383_02210 [Gammaproteobacteria bacterium]